MKVKTLREHQNQFGNNFLKKEGEVYLHPRPEADIAFKIVEEANEKAILTAKRSKTSDPAESPITATIKTKSPKKAIITNADKPA